MTYDNRLEFNNKKVVTNILPPMTSKGPICNRKYTIYYSPISCEYFLTVGNDYCYEDLNPIFKNEIFARWVTDKNNVHRLKMYVRLDSENPLLTMAKYALYKQFIPHYIRTILWGDRYFFKENKCLLNSLVTVRFISQCEKMNIVEPYGTLKNFK
ncbi:MAG: staygreen family protein [Peptostreptococcaceae bacterium]